MPNQFALDQGGVGRDEYARLLADMMKRFGGDRDRAVRGANVAGGFGNSTAQRFMGGGGVPPMAGAPAPADVPLPQARPVEAPADVPVPTPRPEQSPMRDPSMMWPGATGGNVGRRQAGGGVPQNAQNGQAVSRVSGNSVPPELLQIIMSALA